MSKRSNPPNGVHLSLNDSLVQGLEYLRGRLVDLEAMAHAAVAALEHIPYVPRSRPSPPEEDIVIPTDPSIPASIPAGTPSEPDAKARDPIEDTRVELGRLQALVHGTADAANTVLQLVNALLDKAYGLDRARDNNGSSTASEHRLVPASTLRSMQHLGLRALRSIAERDHHHVHSAGPLHPAVLDRTGDVMRAADARSSHRTSLAPRTSPPDSPLDSPPNSCR